MIIILEVSGHGNGGHGDASVYETDPEVQEALNNGVALGR